MAYDFTADQRSGTLRTCRKAVALPNSFRNDAEICCPGSGPKGIEMRRETASSMPKRNRFAVFAAIGAVAAAALIVGFLTIWKTEAFSIRGQTTAPLIKPPWLFQVRTPNLPKFQDAHLREQLASARAELSALDAKIKAQADELASASKAKDTLNSRVADVERENASLLLSDKPSLKLESAQLQAELEKSRVGKERKRCRIGSAGDRTSRASKKGRRSGRGVGPATGVRSESR